MWRDGLFPSFFPPVFFTDPSVYVSPLICFRFCFVGPFVASLTLSLPQGIVDLSPHPASEGGMMPFAVVGSIFGGWPGSIRTPFFYWFTRYQMSDFTPRPMSSTKLKPDGCQCHFFFKKHVNAKQYLILIMYHTMSNLRPPTSSSELCPLEVGPPVSMTFRGTPFLMQNAIGESPTPPPSAVWPQLTPFGSGS